MRGFEILLVIALSLDAIEACANKRAARKSNSLLNEDIYKFSSMENENELAHNLGFDSKQKIDDSKSERSFVRQTLTHMFVKNLHSLETSSLKPVAAKFMGGGLEIQPHFYDDTNEIMPLVKRPQDKAMQEIFEIRLSKTAIRKRDFDIFAVTDYINNNWLNIKPDSLRALLNHLMEWRVERCTANFHAEVKTAYLKKYSDNADPKSYNQKAFMATAVRMFDDITHYCGQRELAWMQNFVLSLESQQVVIPLTIG